jgi:hypothetical protein
MKCTNRTTATTSTTAPAAPAAAAPPPPPRAIGSVSDAKAAMSSLRDELVYAQSDEGKAERARKKAGVATKREAKKLEKEGKLEKEAGG